MSEVFADPQTFRPERWITGDGTLRRTPQPEFLPFGGGAHRCIGSVMATTQLSVLLARLLGRPAYQVYATDPGDRPGCHAPPRRPAGHRRRKRPCCGDQQVTSKGHPGRHTRTAQHP